MLLVCLSHFTAVYFRAEYQTAGNLIPVQIAMLASPTFMAVSGMMIGLMSVVYKRGFDKLRIKLVDRALFILTVGHILIVIARYFERDGAAALRTTVITDAVGICVIIGVWLVPRTRASTRILLGLGLFAAAWALLFIWHPVATWNMVAKEILVGGMPNRVMWYTVPWLQWLGVYMVSTAWGQYIGQLYVRDDRRAVERSFAILAALAIAAGVLLRVGSWAFRPAAHGNTWLYEPFFSPWSKESPSPVYVLFFGGLGMALVWLVVVVSHRRLGARLLDSVTRIGRTSLAVFIIQQFVYYSIMSNIPLPRTRAWPLLFLVSLVPIVVFARVWDQRQLNRALTVGAQGFLHRRLERRKAAQPSAA